MKNSNWTDIPIIELFPSIQRGKRHKKADHILGNIPYVSSTGNNNGIDAFLTLNPKNRIYNNCLTIANSGTVGSAFYHQYQFIASDHVTHLKNNSYNKYQYLFLASSLYKQKNNFNFNREINDERIKKMHIMLPVTIQNKPNLEYMEQYTKDIYTKKLTQYKIYLETQLSLLGTYKEITSLENKDWNEFRFIDIFDIKGGFYNKKPKASKDGTIPFLGASENNNGITQFLSIDTIKKSSKTGKLPNENFDKKIFDGNCIAITNNGSVGHAYYQPHSFTCSHDITCVYLKVNKLNKYIALFLINSIQYSGKTFQFARKWRPKRMKYSKIMLPVNKNGKPDWQYMEQYAKNIMIKKYHQYLAYIDKN